MGELWVALAVVGGILGAFLLLLFVVALWEKHEVRAYSGMLGDEALRGRPYLEEMLDQAEDHGLVGRSVHRHVKYDVVVAFWYTPERDTLVHCGQGKLAGLPAKQTWLYSWLDDGTVLVTTDEFDEGDQSGLYRFKRVVNAAFGELLAAHRKRLDAAPAEPVLFAEPVGADAVMAIQRERAERLVARGRARWVGPPGTTWRFSVRGALFVWISFFRQLGTGLAQIWRLFRRRPGG